MKYDPQIHHRRSIRLKGYDYTQAGAYFVTICSYQREEMFGVVKERKMNLNRAGQIVRAAWLDLPRHYTHVRLETFCAMPNHIHGVIVLVEGNAITKGRGGSGSTNERMPVVAQTCPHEVDGMLVDKGGSGSMNSTLPITSQTRPYEANVRHGLPEIVRAFKSFSARRINFIRHAIGSPVWQRNYFEHIIRNDTELKTICEYINANPLRWQEDSLNPTHR
jgi:REP element-mobilizing transposase RayT